MPSTALTPHDHRPWPRPGRPWLTAMAWLDLLFAHWPVEPAVMRRLVPETLPLDTFDGRAWVGVVPFDMTVRPRLTPALPGLSRFLELNVRTYVTVAGKPGVYFFSLDAANPLAVSAARRFFHLPYFNAKMTLARRDGWFEYASSRTHRGTPPAQFVGRYRPVGEVYRSEPGRIDHWLTERYCLYTLDRRGRVRRYEIDHAPWPLQPAEARIDHDTTTQAAGLAVSGEPLLHFARRLDVVAWSLDVVE